MNDDIDTNFSQVERALLELSKPNWAEWESVKEAKLWEFVALALDIDPRTFRFFGEHKLDKVFTDRQPHRFARLLERAIGNISPGGVLKPLSIDLDNPEESIVRLSNFVKWTKFFKVTFPPGFPSPVTRSVVRVNKKFQMEDERSILLILIAVLAEEAKLDLTRPSKAAMNLEEFTVRLGTRVASRTIENHLKRIGVTFTTPFKERERTTLLILLAALANELKSPPSPTTLAGLLEALARNHGYEIDSSVIEGHLTRMKEAIEKRSR